MCRSFGSFSELLCRVRHVCRFLRLCGDRAALQAAGRIPQSWAPCGTDMAITASSPSSAGAGHISVGLWVLVNIIGRWCGKPTVLVRTQRATSQIKLKDRRPCLLLFQEEWHIGLGYGAFSSSAIKHSTKIWNTIEWRLRGNEAVLKYQCSFFIS